LALDKTGITDVVEIARCEAAKIRCGSQSGSIKVEFWSRFSSSRRKMWSSVTAAGTENGPAPPSRSKHSATLLAGHVYLLGGRNGNLPLKDLWRYSLGEFACQSLARIVQMRNAQFALIFRIFICREKNNSHNYRARQSISCGLARARARLRASFLTSTPHRIRRRAPMERGVRAGIWTGFSLINNAPLLKPTYNDANPRGDATHTIAWWFPRRSDTWINCTRRNRRAYVSDRERFSFGVSLASSVSSAESPERSNHDASRCARALDQRSESIHSRSTFGRDYKG